MNQILLFAKVDPQTWIISGPILIVLLLIYLGPPDMWIKRAFKEAALAKSIAYRAIQSQDDLFERRERVDRFGPWLFWGVYLILLFMTIYTYLVWLGVIAK